MAKKNDRDRSRSNGVLEMARERPVAAVAAAAGAAAAGLFLWSKRTQISDQLGQISDQIGEWSATFKRRQRVGNRGRSYRADRQQIVLPHQRPAGALRRRRQGRYRRPFLCARNCAIASPNSGLVMLLICVPGISA